MEQEELLKKKLSNPFISSGKGFNKFFFNKKIYTCSDYHLWKYKNNKIIKNSIFDEIIKNQINTVTDDDIFIYLGDLVDGEFRDQQLLKKTLLKLKGYKILILGNNDIFDISFYYECGFKYVLEALKWRDIVFSHIPLKLNNGNINIHGHIHGANTYYDVPKTKKHIKIYNRENNHMPLEVHELLKGI